MKHRIGAALLAASAVFALSACATDGYGYGGVGYGSGYYAGDPYWGWYDDYYYPGTGYYIYDRGGTRHRWNDSHRRYWEGRRGNHRPTRPNWSGYRPDGTPPAWRGRPQGTTTPPPRREPSWRGRPQGQAPGATSPNREPSWRGQRQQQPGASSENRQQRREEWRARRQQSGESGRNRGN